MIAAVGKIPVIAPKDTVIQEPAVEITNPTAVPGEPVMKKD